jgi:transcriptional regulator with XRE-family HTH domain
MDAKSIGNTIAKFRKKMGLTQSQLASRLNISDKTVSRWRADSVFLRLHSFLH